MNCDGIKRTDSVAIIILMKRSASYQIFRIYFLENRHPTLTDDCVSHYIAHNAARISSPGRTINPLEIIEKSVFPSCDYMVWVPSALKTTCFYPCEQLEIMKTTT